MSRKPLADPLVEEAIQWMVRLQSGETTEQERRALEHWLSTSPRHEAAFQKISQGLSPLRESPWRSRSGDQLLSAMRAPSGRRQFLRASLALAGLALAAGAILRVERAGLALPGDLYTGTGERRSWNLEDGSRIDLNARSVVAMLATTPEETHPSPQEQWILVESLLAIDRMLDGLSRQAKSVFVYSQIDGLTYSQIGERLGLSLGRVHQLMAEALRCCYQELAG